VITSTQHLITEYSFPPLLGEKPTILILGSMPSVQSLKHQQYYAHPRNAFWPIMAELFSFSTTLPYLERCSLLAQHHIAVWDVLKACQRKGSLDSNIDTGSIVVNDFNNFLQRYPSINRLYFNGTKAESLFKQTIPSLSQQFIAIPTQRLPSTSPAHAAMSFDQKLEAWRQILNIKN